MSQDNKISARRNTQRAGMDWLNDEMLKDDNEIGRRRESVNLPFYLGTAKNELSMVLDAEGLNRLRKRRVGVHDVACAQQKLLRSNYGFQTVRGLDCRP
jgi:hypothetical protein